MRQFLFLTVIVVSHLIVIAKSENENFRMVKSIKDLFNVSVFNENVVHTYDSYLKMNSKKISKEPYVNDLFIKNRPKKSTINLKNGDKSSVNSYSLEFTEERDPVIPVSVL